VSLLQLQGIHKRFGGVHALKGVDFELERGEIHALVGENGAGKSTLIKILSGVHRPDGGTIRLDGEEVQIHDPKAARELGVVTIFQETSAYADLSVLENLFMGLQPRTRLGLLDWPRMRREAEAVVARLGIRLPLSARMGDLSRAQVKLVEIAKALLQRARVLIMDEPTAALLADDVERLFAIIKGLKEQGVAVIYISHRLEEVFRLADRVTVLRDGERVGSEAVAAASQEWLIQKMVGRQLEELYTRHLRARGKPLLEVRGLTRTGIFEEVSFAVHEGEIVALAGLVGSGRSEVARAVFGLDPYDAGAVRFGGAPLSPHPWKAVDAGLALLPEDRTRQGLVLPFSVKNNLTLAALHAFQRGGFVDEPAEYDLAERFIRSLGIRTPGADVPTLNLSGGNQQKVVLGKWLAVDPKVLILDEPTQGVDVGAKTEIHRLMDDLVHRGLGILLISSDLPEVLGMADRILVMHRGRLVAELPRGAGAEAVMRPATGLGVREEAHVR
jgi:rhamnose transport system ATP-binding protein